MLHLLLLVLIGLLITVVVVGLLSVLFLRFAPTFGGRPNAETLKRIRSSANFDGKTFVNLTKTQASTVNFSTVSADTTQKNGNFLWHFVFHPKDKNPSKPIVTHPLNLIANDATHSRNTSNVNNTSNTNKATASAQPSTTTLNNGDFVWLGHATVLFRSANKTLLTDPVFHPATPLPIGVKPFAMTHTPTADDLPFIDAVLISHDHYDHLDHKAIMQIKHKVGHFYVPLGVQAHLVRWGVPEANISEFDWYESVTIAQPEQSTAAASLQHSASASSAVSHDINPDTKHNHAGSATNQITLTFAPTRHFSGRRIKGHRETLWGSWVVQAPQLSVYFSGDGGYSPEFAEIGKRFGGFDIAFIEDGAYSELWRDVHMLPEESAQAGIDVGAKVVLPIHWGKFDLSNHHWREPVRRIKAAFDGYNAGKTEHEQIAVATPRIGEVFSLQDLPTSKWWEDE